MYLCLIDALLYYPISRCLDQLRTRDQSQVANVVISPGQLSTIRAQWSGEGQPGGQGADDDPGSGGR